MIAVVQRVNSCVVSIDNKDSSSIGVGVLVLLGIEDGDGFDDIKYCAKKLINLRIFNDNHDKMNLSVIDVNAEIMIVSQFTLCGNTKKGNRPSYVSAMDVNLAKKLYNKFLDYMNQCYSKVKSGTFQADMNIKLENSGPVTLIIRSRNS